MVNVKVPLLAAIHLYHAVFASIEPPIGDESKQVPADSLLFKPAPDTFIGETLSFEHNKEALLQSCPG